MNAEIINSACSLASLAPPHDLRLIAYAMGACAATLKYNGASYVNSAVACMLSATPTPLTQEQWCENTAGTACLNAWGGGPWVDDSTTGFESGDNH